MENRTKALSLMLVAAAVTVTACGGGSSGSSGGGGAATVAATCSSLTSGAYRLIKPAADGSLTVTGVVDVAMDAGGNPQITQLDKTVVTLKPGSTPCSFSAGNTGFVVSPARVVVTSSQESDGLRYASLLMPEQTVALSELTGTWNRIGWQRAGTGGLSKPYELSYGSITLSSGVVSNIVGCPVSELGGSCTGTGAAAGTGFTVSAAGGYNGAGDLSGSRGFAYKSGGNIMLLLVDPDGSLHIFTPQVAQALPSVGSTSTTWTVQPTTDGSLVVANTNVMPGISTLVVTITGVDSASSTVTRTQSNDGGTAVSQTLHYNSPMLGFRKRDAASGVSPIVQLPVPGMGITVSARIGATAATAPGTGNGFFTFSINQP